MKTQIVKNTIAVTLAIMMTACGQTMTGFSSGSSSITGAGQTTQTPEIQFEKIEESTKEAELALQEAQVALDNLVKDGSINVDGEGSYIVGAKVSAKSLTGIPERVGKWLDKLYVKLTIPVTKAKEISAQARAQLVAALSKLDPANPVHQAMIAKLTEMMSRLDGLESRFGVVYQLLAIKVDVVIGQLDLLIAGLSTNPLLFLPVMELRELRNVIVAFRDKLANT